MAHQDLIRVIKYIAAGLTPEEVERKSHIEGKRIRKEYADKITKEIREQGMHMDLYVPAVRQWEKVMAVFPLSQIYVRMKNLEELLLDVKDMRSKAADWKSKSELAKQERALLRDIARESAQIPMAEAMETITNTKFYDQRDKFFAMLMEDIKAGVFTDAQKEKFMEVLIEVKGKARNNPSGKGAKKTP